MSEPLNQIIHLFEGPIPGERARLVRLCAAITGHPEAAEDLAQEALLEAWRSRERLVEPEGYSRWLSVVARNVCLRWMRDQDIRSTRETPGDPDGEESLAARTPDLEIELERGELADLLDRALDELPADTRAALVQRYLLELPQAEIASRLGLSEGAVEARLHRGKLSLHRILLDRYRPEAVAFGLAAPGSSEWVETRLWCPICGQHHLYGILPQAASGQVGQFELHCPKCTGLPQSWFAQSTWIPEFEQVKGFRATLKRLDAYITALFQPRLVRDSLTCRRCGQPVPIQFELPSSVHAIPGMGRRGLYIRCPSCGSSSHNDIYGIAIETPAVQRFWRDHPRMRTLPEVEVQSGGSSALLVRFESLSSSAACEVLLSGDRYAVLETRPASQA